MLSEDTLLCFIPSSLVKNEIRLERLQCDAGEASPSGTEQRTLPGDSLTGDLPGARQTSRPLKARLLLQRAWIGFPAPASSRSSTCCLASANRTTPMHWLDRQKLYPLSLLLSFAFFAMLIIKPIASVCQASPPPLSNTTNSIYVYLCQSFHCLDAGN